MKKIVFSLFLALFMLVFTGCSCTAEAVLSFDNLWDGKTIGYSESLVYSVDLSSDYKESSFAYEKSEALSNLTVSITGAYTVVNEILSKEDPSVPEKVKENAVYKTIEHAVSVVRCSSALNLSAKYSIGDKTETSEDKIVTTAYFYNYDDSFAPIYTEREIDYKYPSVFNGKVVLTEMKGKDYVEYLSDKYVVRTEYGEGKESETEYKHTLKTVIDNAALFLAIRNKSLDLDASYAVPVVHPSYGSSQTLAVTRFADLNKRITFDYNGTETTVDFAVKGMSFGVNSTNSSGIKQLAFVQNGESGGINKSLIIEYAEPLVEYSGFNKMGALVYTLKSATYA